VVLLSVTVNGEAGIRREKKNEGGAWDPLRRSSRATRRALLEEPADACGLLPLRREGELNGGGTSTCRGGLRKVKVGR
jgi:hypothetical protein